MKKIKLTKIGETTKSNLIIKGAALDEYKKLKSDINENRSLPIPGAIIKAAYWNAEGKADKAKEAIDSYAKEAVKTG